jgi:hypothetical protein
VANKAELKVIHDETLQFAEMLSQLCKHSFGESSNTTSRVKLSTVPALHKLRKFEATEVLIPTESALAGALPLNGRADKDWDPFGALQPAKLQFVLDEVEVIRSLQTPKVY